MASCMCSLLFVIFTFSPTRAVDPAAIKIRITSHALNMLSEEARLMFQEQVAETTFEGFQGEGCTVSNVKVTKVDVNQVHLRLVENYGFEFMIENFGFTINFDSNPDLCFYKSRGFVLAGFTATLEVGLTGNEERRLATDIRTCQVSLDQMRFTGKGVKWFFKEKFQNVVARFVSPSFCKILRNVVPPFLNKILNMIPMPVTVLPEPCIRFDYSLTRDIRVTATTLDMAFKGQAYRKPQPPAGDDDVEPVFTEEARMVYVGVSEFFFNSAARSLYEAGMAEIQFDNIHWFATPFLKAIQLITQPWNLLTGLEARLKLNEAPTIRITQQDGFTINVIAKVEVISNGTESTVFSLSAVCPVRIVVAIQGTNLTLASTDVSCNLSPTRSIGETPLDRLLNDRATAYLTGWFGDGVKIPIPEGVNLTQGNIQYRNGYVVAGGDLHFTPTGRQQLADRQRDSGR